MGRFLLVRHVSAFTEPFPQVSCILSCFLYYARSSAGHLMFWELHVRATIRKALLVSCVPQQMANLTRPTHQGCPWLCGAAAAGAAGQAWGCVGRTRPGRAAPAVERATSTIRPCPDSVHVPEPFVLHLNTENNLSF